MQMSANEQSSISVSSSGDLVSVAELWLEYRSGFLGRQRIQALRGVELSVARGQSVAVVGPNGSGKSSLFRCLLGLERPERGRIEVLGASPGSKAALRRIGYMAEGRAPLPKLRAHELLTLSGTLAGWSPGDARQRADEVLEIVDLSAAARRMHGEFSTGMARRLAFAQAIFFAPELLVLDEPTSGMDPLGIGIVRRELRAHCDRGGSVLVATHGLEDVGHCDQMCVLLTGERVAMGPPAEILGVEGQRELVAIGLSDDELASVGARLRELGAKTEVRNAQQSLGDLLLRVFDERRRGGPQ